MRTFLKKKKDIIVGILMGLLLLVVLRPYIDDITFARKGGTINIAGYENLKEPSFYDEKVDAETFLKNTNRPAVLYFYANWCKFCIKDLAFVLSFKKEYENRVDVLFINADTHPQILAGLNLKGIPKYLLFNPKTKKITDLGSISFISGVRFKKQIEEVLKTF
jgi:thiol-disulfide isomerase/thioredoxin